MPRRKIKMVSKKGLRRPCSGRLEPRAYFRRKPSFCGARRRTSGDCRFTFGYLSRQWNGRPASMMARLSVKSPFALRPGSMSPVAAPGLALFRHAVDRVGHCGL
jgi:hypothetical protein